MGSQPAGTHCYHPRHTNLLARAGTLDGAVPTGHPADDGQSRKASLRHQGRGHHYHHISGAEVLPVPTEYATPNWELVCVSVGWSTQRRGGHGLSELLKIGCQLVGSYLSLREDAPKPHPLPDRWFWVHGGSPTHQEKSRSCALSCTHTR